MIRTDTVRPTLHAQRGWDARPIPLHAFVRHARLFGPECVVETARACLSASEVATLELEVALLARSNGKPAARRRATTPALVEQVAELQRRGLVPAAIADALNISDRRARGLLAKVQPHENGGRNPSIQAVLFVDVA